MLAYLGLIVGLLLLAYGVLSYMGSSVLASAPAPLRRAGDALWLAGIALLAVAALLGWVGMMMDTNVFILRILAAIAGLVLLGLAWPRAAKA